MTSCAVLFSGGLDSTTALYWACRRYGEVRALTFDYGQRHRVEVRMARKIARGLEIPQSVLRADLTQIGGSALTDSRIPVPSHRALPRRARRPPSTYGPFRNGILLSLAAAWAEPRGISELVCGFHVLDSPDYPDTRAPFVRAMEKAINAGTKAACEGPPFRIRAPVLRMSKAAIIREGLRLGADYSYSVSCYAGREVPCGTCPACALRRRAWKEAGLEDPLLRRLRKEVHR
jgi:7-cyano-7-deazaguanine synthase